MFDWGFWGIILYVAWTIFKNQYLSWWPAYVLTLMINYALGTILTPFDVVVTTIIWLALRSLMILWVGPLTTTTRGPQNATVSQETVDKYNGL